MTNIKKQEANCCGIRETEHLESIVSQLCIFLVQTLRQIQITNIVCLKEEVSHNFYYVPFLCAEQ